MPLWWLCYRRSGRIEVAIVEAASMMHARLRATLDEIDADATFAEGHKLDAERAARAIRVRDSLVRPTCSGEKKRRLTLATHHRRQREAGEAIPTRSVKFGAGRPAG